MADQDQGTRETTVVTSSGGGAGWFVAVLLLLVIAFGGWYAYSSGMLSDSNDINVTIDVPDVNVPAE